MLGAVAFRLAVLPRWRGTHEWRQAIPGADEALGRLGLRAAVVALVAMPLILVDQIILFRDPFSPVLAELDLLVTATTWGRMWQLQLLSVGLATVVFAFVWRRSGKTTGTTLAWRIAAGATLFCAMVPALSGHSVGTDRFHVLAVGADALHIIAAGVWIGTLCALVVVVHAATKRGAVASDILPDAVVSFSPVALLSAGVLVGTGLFATWLHVGTLGHLFSSTYGRILLAKVGLVGVTAGLGAHNWKRVTPRLGSTEGSKAFMSRSARSEIVIGLLVLLLTAVLVVTSHPVAG